MEVTPPPGTPDAHNSDAPLTEADYALIREATARRTVIRKAADRAARSAKITLVLGILALPLVVLAFSWPGAMITAGLLVVGSFEQWGSRQMLRADLRAPKFLCRNQLAFIAVISAYCIWQMLAFSAGDAVSPEVRSQFANLPGIESMVADLEERIPLLVYGFYTLIILVSLFFQLRLARYYHTRRHDIATYHTDTPDWVKRMMEETTG